MLDGTRRRSDGLRWVFSPAQISRCQFLFVTLCCTTICIFSARVPGILGGTSAKESHAVHPVLGCTLCCGRCTLCCGRCTLCWGAPCAVGGAPCAGAAQSHLTLILTLTLTLNHNPNLNPIQNALVYISFCVAQKKSEIRALEHDT